MSIIFDKSVPGRTGVTFPGLDVPVDGEVAVPDEFRRQAELALCELSELDVVRHFTGLSKKNFGVDTGFYPLGSCTMKYNPKILEKIAGWEGFSLHPFLPRVRGGEIVSQGSLRVLYELERQLCEIAGMEAFTLQPLAGAHGELTGMMLVAAYHRHKGNRKTEVLIPDEAHGTNPSSAGIAGYGVRPVPTNTTTGMLDMTVLESMISDQTAAIMLTNPNTLGIFNSNIGKIADIAHKHDALVYYDGANLNAIMGKFRPGDAGVDVMHINLHKTFATPHGGGGPGAGPVGVNSKLAEFLPVPRVKKDGNHYALDNEHPLSIGPVAPFYGNFLVCLKAYIYITLLGADGLREVSENAVLNANYIMNALKEYYDLPFDLPCMHEFVLSAEKQVAHHVHALDIAKALIDMGFHPPTIYFPLIVKEAMMIEPTETESRETLDAFISAMIQIAKLAKDHPEKIQSAPISTPVNRPDEVKAAKDMDFAYTKNVL